MSVERITLNTPQQHPEWDTGSSGENATEPIVLAEWVESHSLDTPTRAANQSAFNVAELRCKTCPYLGRRAYKCAYEISNHMQELSAATMIIKNCQGVVDDNNRNPHNAVPLPMHGVR